MKFSYHNHSTHSDGKNSIDEIVAHAEHLNLDEIGIADHFTLPIGGQKEAPAYAIKDLNAYITDIQRFSGHTHPTVKLGIEADFYPEKIDEIKTKLSNKPFDYIIGSVHVVDTLPIDFKPELLNDLSEEERNRHIKRYWELVRQMAETRFFDIVGHLDLPKKFNIYATCDLTQEINAALNAIKDADMTVELNTSGWSLPCKEQYPSLELLQKCKQRNIPVMVSADAHSAEHIARDFDKAYELLMDIGYTQLAYYTKRQRLFIQL